MNTKSDTTANDVTDETSNMTSKSESDSKSNMDNTSNVKNKFDGNMQSVNTTVHVDPFELTKRLFESGGMLTEFKRAAIDEGLFNRNTYL